jgi:multicomponent Na+:H+ antiporter subunit F
MAGLNAWGVASLALVPALAFCLWCAARGAVAQRLVAAQFGGSIATFQLAALTFALSEPSSVDLALTLTILTLPATLLFAVFVERWL